MKRSISIFFAAIILSVLPSCHLLRLPVNILEGLGGLAGVTDLIPLTDEVPQPELPLEVNSIVDSDTTE